LDLDGFVATNLGFLGFTRWGYRRAVPGGVYIVSGVSGERILTEEHVLDSRSAPLASPDGCKVVANLVPANTSGEIIDLRLTIIDVCAGKRTPSSR
jgi:hypothetical protein